MTPDPVRVAILLAAIVLASGTLPANADIGAHPDTVNIATYEQTATLQLYQRFIKEAYLRLGVTTRYTVLPALRAVRATDQGDLDAILIASIEAETGADSIVRVAEALPDLHFRVVARSDMPVETLPEDLGPYYVGYLRGIHPLERQFDEKTRKLPINGGFDTLIEILKLERIDLAALPSLEAEMLARQHQELKILRAPVYTFTVFHYVHQDHKGLSASLAEIFRELKQDERCMERLSQVALNHDLDTDRDKLRDLVNAPDYEPLCATASR